jgi:hypothetical protein
MILPAKLLLLSALMHACASEPSGSEALVCTPYQTLCVGGDVYVCQPDGSVDFAKACASWETCNEGLCVGDPPVSDTSNDAGETTTDSEELDSVDVERPETTPALDSVEPEVRDIGVDGAETSQDVTGSDSAMTDSELIADADGSNDVPPESDSAVVMDSIEPTEDTVSPPTSPHLVDENAWVMATAPDPFWTDNPEHDLCEPFLAYEVEDYSPELAEILFVISTVTCNYATVQQPLLQPIAAGTTVHMAYHHTKLGPAEGTYVVALAVGEPAKTVWTWTLPIPTNTGGFVKAQWTAGETFQKGETIYWHVSNHGPNAWAVVDISLEEIPLPEPPEPLGFGACSVPGDAILLFDEVFFADVSDECMMQCGNPAAGTYITCMSDCLSDTFSTPCSGCIATYVGCFSNDCPCPPGPPTDECNACMFGTCKVNFDQCAGVELPWG